MKIEKATKWISEEMTCAYRSFIFSRLFKKLNIVKLEKTLTK
jgi:hypothetical protein